MNDEEYDKQLLNDLYVKVHYLDQIVKMHRFCFWAIGALQLLILFTQVKYIWSI